jgi:hypothetical protein
MLGLAVSRAQAQTVQQGNTKPRYPVSYNGYGQRLDVDGQRSALKSISLRIFPQ